MDPTESATSHGFRHISTRGKAITIRLPIDVESHVSRAQPHAVTSVRRSIGGDTRSSEHLGGEPRPPVLARQPLPPLRIRPRRRFLDAHLDEAGEALVFVGQGDVLSREPARRVEQRSVETAGSPAARSSRVLSRKLD
jgi:hypothetical protein